MQHQKEKEEKGRMPSKPPELPLDLQCTCYFKSTAARCYSGSTQCTLHQNPPGIGGKRAKVPLLLQKRRVKLFFVVYCCSSAGVLRWKPASWLTKGLATSHSSSRAGLRELLALVPGCAQEEEDTEEDKELEQDYCDVNVLP